MKKLTQPHFHIKLTAIDPREYKKFRIKLLTKDLSLQEWFTKKIREEINEEIVL